MANMVIFECDKDDLLDSPKHKPMQIQLVGPSKRSVLMLLRVSVTKLVKCALDNTLFELAPTGYTVFTSLY